MKIFISSKKKKKKKKRKKKFNILNQNIEFTVSKIIKIIINI